MKLIEKKQLESKISFVVETTKEQWDEANEKAFNAVAKKTAQKLNLPGFRKGKAPMSEVKKYVDNIEVYEKATNLIAPKMVEFVEQTPEFVNDNSETVDVPTLSIDGINDGKLKMEISYDIYPTVTISKYDDLVLDLPEVSVSEAEVENEISHAQKRFSKKEEKAEELGIEKGDIATFSFIGRIDNEPFEGGSADSFELEIGSNQFIPGFEEQMLGLKKGEEKSLNLKFPDNYHVDTLAGKPVVFDVKIQKITNVITPALDDDFAKQVGFKDVETYEQLKEKVTSLILEAKKDNYSQISSQQITTELLNRSTITEIPQSLLNREFATLEQQVKMRLNEMNIDLKRYLEISNKSEDQFKAELYEQAKATIKLALVISKIAEEEKIEVSEEEAKARALEMAQYYGSNNEEATNKYLSENLELVKEFITHKKVMDFIAQLNKDNKPDENKIATKQKESTKLTKKVSKKPDVKK